MRALLFICSLGESKRIPAPPLRQKTGQILKGLDERNQYHWVALEKCRGMKREIEVNREMREVFFLPRGQGGVMGTARPLALQKAAVHCF